MKKILLLVIFCIGLVSCDPGKWLYSNDGFWYVKNNTSDVILISNTEQFVKQPLSPKDSINIFVIGFSLGDNILPEFNNFREGKYQGREIHINIQVYSKEGKLLQTWDNKDGQSLKSDFFNESKWRVHRKDNANKSVEISWTYDITDKSLRQ